MNQPKANNDDEDLDADAVLAELEAEEDNDISTLRNQRISALESSSTSNSKFNPTTTSTLKQSTYTTLTSDDSTLQHTTEHEKAIVHFFHPDFARCSIMDEHLIVIAQKHADFGTDAARDEVQFARVDVRHAEFVVQKLGIRVLPCVIGFVKGQIKGRIVGFEGVLWDGREKGLAVTRTVEETFVDWGILRRGLVKQREEDESESEQEDIPGTGRRGIKGRKQATEDNDDDWD